MAAVAISSVVGEAGAQSKSSFMVPAEFPPSSYGGRQYVDSRGCVYIRAGIDGEVNWVPRMTRNRKVICGFEPSLPGGAATAGSQPAATGAASPVRIEVPKQPASVAKPRTRPAATAATTKPATSAPATAAAASKAAARAAPAAEQRQVRVVPRHVDAQQRASLQGISIPEGYKPVWDDDRLNPRRAQQTLAGKAQMELVWTNTVPRVLIERSTGETVSRNDTGLQTSLGRNKSHNAAGTVVATRGSAAKEPARTRKRSQAAIVSTRAAGAGATGQRYVQAGVFGDRGNAQRAAERIARAGLPARLGRFSKNGTSYTVVLAGPFETQPQLQTALSRVRKAGFGDAFARK